MFLKADRALSNLNFLFHLKLETNLETLKTCNSHLQCYKIDLSFSIKFHGSIHDEINKYVFLYHKISLCASAAETRFSVTVGSKAMLYSPLQRNAM